MRVKGKMVCVCVCGFFFKAGYYIVRKLLYSLSSFSWKRFTSLSCQNKVLFQLNYYSSELLPRKLNRRLTKYPAKRMPFKKRTAVFTVVQYLPIDHLKVQKLENDTLQLWKIPLLRIQMFCKGENFLQQIWLNF